MLEAAALDRAVDAALLRRARLPPPAAVARSLARLDRARARRAADRRVPLRVERMHRQVVLADVVPRLFLGPFGERVELDDAAVVVVDLDLADVRAARPLVAPEPGDPRVEAGQMPVQRPHLAHVAAEQPVVDAAAEEVLAVRARHPLDLGAVRQQDAQVEARVAVAEVFDRLVALLRQAPRVDREHLDLRIELVGEIDQDHVVGLQRGRDRDARREALEGPLEHRLRLLALELDRQLTCLQLVDQLNAHAASSRCRARAGSRPARAPRSSSLDRRLNSEKDSPGSRPCSQPLDQPGDGGIELVGRDAAEQRLADRGACAEPAADEDVVGLPPGAVLVAGGRALEAEIADPVLGARVRAAVEVQPQVGDVVAEARLEPVDEPAEPRLRLGHREVAVRLAGAGDRVAPDRVRVEREADRGELARDPLGLRLGDADQDQVLLAGDPDRRLPPARRGRRSRSAGRPRSGRAGSERRSSRAPARAAAGCRGGCPGRDAAGSRV